jgi:hypothetical protein
LSESVQTAWLSCAYLDVISIHAYGVGDFSTSAIQSYVSKAQNAGKKLLFQEWQVLSTLAYSILSYLRKGCLLLQHGEQQLPHWKCT